MSLFDRLARIAKSSVDEFVRALEGDDDEGVMEAPVSDLELALGEARKSAVKCEMGYRKMEVERDQYLKEIQDLNEKAANQLTAGQEEEARISLEKKVELEARVVKLQPAIELGRETAAGLKGELQEMQSRLDEANRKLAELETRKRAADAREALEKLRTQLDQEEDLEADELQLVEREVELELEQELRSLEEPGAEFDRIHLNSKLDAQIDALKKKLDLNGDENNA